MKGKKLPEAWHEPWAVTPLPDPEEEEEEGEEEEEEEKLEERSRRQVRGSPMALGLRDLSVLLLLHVTVPWCSWVPVAPRQCHRTSVPSALGPGLAPPPAPRAAALPSPLPVAAVAAGDQTSAGGS